MRKWSLILLIMAVTLNCTKNKPQNKIVEGNSETPFLWEAATIYFLLTDRFNNGSQHNDVNFNRTAQTGVLRGFEGGDIIGITKKIEEGYFNNLGVNAIWFTPVVEQIHGAVDEGTGFTNAYHGYWTKDWTALDPNFGTKDDLKNLVDVAHKNGIRIILDGVINHTGPVTEQDPVWPNNWVRTGPPCRYQDYNSTIACTLVENLPDILTESNEAVEIPEHLAQKWKNEGRYEQEMKELDEFFERTGYPRAPKFYIIKWLADYIVEFGVDGYRADTVKHTEEDVWGFFKTECDYAFNLWKQNNPDKVLDNSNFYLVGEVYNYGISGGQFFDFGDKKVNYFENGFQSLINFEFKWNAKENYESIFSKYSNILSNELKNFGVVNYLASHDDGSPFDKERLLAKETATKLLLSPGTAQIYYGDETARPLVIEGAVGDANLRSFMNWEDLMNDENTIEIHQHWQKLGVFRKNHPSIGAGTHKMISEFPYVFERTLSKDNYFDCVVVGLNLVEGEKEISVGSNFKDGDILIDAYSGAIVKVEKNKVKLNTPYDIVLLEKSN
jgi:alpha-amylase